MKKCITGILLLSSALILCQAGEYSEKLKDREKWIKKVSADDKEISEIIRKKADEDGLWYWLTHSPAGRRNREKEREKELAKWDEKKTKHQEELDEINRKIKNIEENTVVTITRIEMDGVPDFDGGKPNGRADLRICFRSRGIRSPFISEENIGRTVDISCDVLLKKGDDIVIKDEDVSTWEDMGQISCADIFLHAWKNDSSFGVFEKEIETSITKENKIQSYTIRIHYTKERQGAN